MIVSPTEPLKLIFSLYEHEGLGYIPSAFIVKLTDSGGFSLQYQSISSANVGDFKSKLTDNQIKLVDLSSKIQPEAIYKKFKGKFKKINEEDFFGRLFGKKKDAETKKDKELDTLKDYLLSYFESHKRDIYKNIKQEQLFIMGTDGTPIWRKLHIEEESAKAYFHFIREADKTIYYPIIKCGEEKLKFQFQGGMIINDLPAVAVINEKVYFFDNYADGKKLRPFLNRANIEIPHSLEETYYKKFIAPLIANFNVFAQGFEIVYEKEEFSVHLLVTDGARVQKNLLDEVVSNDDSAEVWLEIIFSYGVYDFRFSNYSDPAYVFLEKTSDSWRFHKIKRNLSKEKEVISHLTHQNLPIKHGKVALPQVEALKWLADHHEFLKLHNIEVRQNESNAFVFFMGYTNITLKIEEKQDWFDIETEVIFGEFKIPFKNFRNYILNNVRQFALPNGQIAIIPEVWFTNYSELLANIEGEESPKLNKHFVGLVNMLGKEGLAQTIINRKLSMLADFSEIQEVSLPENFKGELRPYQKAGYDWLHFLKDYNLGGCLADDMGLGKTVTTLAFFQKLKEEGSSQPILLVLPTSLIYNWTREIERFTPKLKVLVHYGPNRSRDIDEFSSFDLVITTYGVLRLDIDFIKKCRFDYAVLDESQTIKNAMSGNFKAVMELNTKNRLILTGTPLENSTIDLWSQMSFINPGLLGTLGQFKEKYYNTIEKEKDEESLKVLTSKIKPFLLRRNKRQVASDLPEKIESIVYCEMTEEQEQLYEETKSFVRNQIMSLKEKGLMKKSSLIILQALTKLRQLANNPTLADPAYKGDSGKANEILEKICQAVSEKSKTLVFSQFVKHLNLVAEMLDKQGIPYLYLDGSTKNRIELVDRFQNKDSEMVFLISLKAGGVGLNLTAAENVFILDPWWNPAIEAQAIDRAHRIGQTKTVFSYKFISQNTIEEKILELQNSKKQLFEDLIIEEESFFKSLNADDILSLTD